MLMKPYFRYYPVTPAQKKWGLYVTSVGHNTTQPGAIYPSPEHPDEYYFTWKVGRTLHEWQICLLEKGQGVVEFKSERFKLRAGSMLVIPPMCWHRYKPDVKTGWTTYWIGFGGDLADRMIGNAGFSREGDVRSINADGPVFRLFASTISELLSTTERLPFSAAARVPSLVAALLESPSGSTSSVSSPILQAQTYITNHQSETIDFTELASSLSISYRSFRYRFAQETGHSPLQFQLGRRLIRAKNLLTSTDMRVKDIAKALGFNSTWYFNHFFQKHTNCSPAIYRKQHRRQGVTNHMRL